MGGEDSLRSPVGEEDNDNRGYQPSHSSHSNYNNVNNASSVTKPILKPTKTLLRPTQNKRVDQYGGQDFDESQGNFNQSQAQNSIPKRDVKNVYSALNSIKKTDDRDNRDES